MKKITFIDLFAGVWWFHLALHNLWWECVSAVEIDKFARETYLLNYYNKSKDVFDNDLFFEDITKTDEKLIPDHDILCAGFPCQAFSIAGYRKWFEDSRWNLFFDILRIIEHKKPKVLFLENVKNLVSHDWWETFKVIVKELESLWYNIKHKVLNSFEYGNVPQNRERTYIVWFKDKNSYDNFDFPENITLEKGVKDILKNEKVDDKYYYNSKPLFEKIKDKITNDNTCYQWRRQYVRENKKWLCPTLTANMWTGWHNVPIIKDNYGIRKLTPWETFRFQWYPEDFLLPNISDAQLYKQAGNSVTVPVLERIAENILKSM